jgi:hypothetical protein
VSGHEKWSTRTSHHINDHRNGALEPVELLVAKTEMEFDREVQRRIDEARGK